jgi:hypothetical protein
LGTLFLISFSENFYVLETRVFFDGILFGAPFLGCEFGHSSSANYEGKNVWSCIFTSSYAFIACTGTTLYLLEHRGDVAPISSN